MKLNPYHRLLTTNPMAKVTHDQVIFKVTISQFLTSSFSALPLFKWHHQCGCPVSFKGDNYFVGIKKQAFLYRKYRNKSKSFLLMDGTWERNNVRARVRWAWRHQAGSLWSGECSGHLCQCREPESVWKPLVWGHVTKYTWTCMESAHRYGQTSMSNRHVFCFYLLYFY